MFLKITTWDFWGINLKPLYFGIFQQKKVKLELLNFSCFEILLKAVDDGIIGGKSKKTEKKQQRKNND